MTVHERDIELEALEQLLGGVARAGDAPNGGLLLFEGPAGIGKTALVEAARERARDLDVRVLSATASALERAFPFGVVHQLLDPVLATADAAAREQLLSGAARHAEAVLAPAAGAGTVEDPGFAALHGLYWLLVNLAERQPVVLLAEDLHWADRASLRALEYAARRTDGVALAIVATVRSGEPDAETALLEALAAGPRARVLRPAPLGHAAARALLGEALRTEPAEAFVSACLAATGGNPLLLRSLAGEAARAALQGADSDADADRLAELGAGDVARVVRRRLGTLGPDAEALAQAAAIAGERCRLDDLAAVAALDPHAAGAAAERLVAAELLQAGTWAFVHPLVREAVIEALAPMRRSALHAAAAARLRAQGVRPEELAVHLLATEPAGDPEAVATLRASAAAAASAGAPDAGVAHLRRALAEPPEAGVRADVLLELGELETQTGDPAAIARLGEALDAGLDGDRAARAHVARGTLRLLSDPGPALDDFEQALADARDPALRLRLEALVLEASTFHARFADRRAALLAAGRADPQPSAAMLAHLAQDTAYRAAGSAADVAELAAQATSAGLLRDLGPLSNTFNLLIHACRYAEQAQQGRALLEDGDAAAQREGLRFASPYLDHAWAYWHLEFGSVASGLAHAEAGLADVRRVGFPVTVAAFSAVAAELLLQHDRTEDAAALLDAVDPVIDDTVAGAFVVAARGWTRRRQLRAVEAEADLRRAVELLDARGWAAPRVAEARLRLAQILGARGERGEAAALLDDAQRAAEALGTPGSLGAVLHARGHVAEGDEAIACLQDAARLLGDSPLLLARGWALHDLGAALRRSGRRVDARDPLRAALDVAARTEAPLLARLAREELEAAGARPQRDALRGPAALTPSERRVAELAAAGHTNRAIAEALWVTRRTVEVHLGNTYTKLGIQGRGQLAAALDSGS